MNKYIYISLLCLLACGCGGQNRGGGKKLVVSIPPLEYIVSQITEGDFDIDILVPAGASPETYEPTPVQMMDVAGAQLVFTTGLIDFERQLTAKIGAQEGEDKIVDLSQVISLIEGDCGHAGHGHGVDPHIWTSPRNLKIMARTAYGRIAQLWPDSAKYRANFDRLDSRLDSLDKAVGDILAVAKTRYFIIYHPALTYLARDYGLRQVALEHEGKEPAADRLKSVIAEARRDGITSIFYQRQFSPATVETMAHEMGARCVEVDPLQEDVFDNILHIASLIASE